MGTTITETWFVLPYLGFSDLFVSHKNQATIIIKELLNRY
jgi:hypothetical protein